MFYPSALTTTQREVWCKALAAQHHCSTEVRGGAGLCFGVSDLGAESIEPQRTLLHTGWGLRRSLQHGTINTSSRPFTMHPWGKLEAHFIFTAASWSHWRPERAHGCRTVFSPHSRLLCSYVCHAHSVPVTSASVWTTTKVKTGDYSLPGFLQQPQHHQNKAQTSLTAEILSSPTLNHHPTSFSSRQTLTDYLIQDKDCNQN